MTVSVSTHVLDTGAGTPAAGIDVALVRHGVVVVAAKTDADGRARLGEGLEPGTYGVVFQPPSPFFRRVELEVALDDGHYHIPLLVSPYACASYRGS